MKLWSTYNPINNLQPIFTIYTTINLKINPTISSKQQPIEIMYQMWIQTCNKEGGLPQLSKYSSKISGLSVINQENVNPMVL